MSLLSLGLLFVVSLVFLVKSADWLLARAEKIGLSWGLSSFVVGVTIVGIGTSLPELISGLMALSQGVTEIVVANNVGSNIANILLVVGFASVFGKKLEISKDLIDLDLPMLAISTVISMVVLFDRVVTFKEGLILIFAYGVYFAYTIFNRDDDTLIEKITQKVSVPKAKLIDYLVVIGSSALLAVSSKYLIESVIGLSELLAIGAGSISLFAVALGTSLPELLVSVKASLKGKGEIALGNIFGSNVFNILIGLGIPALWKELQVDSQTYLIGIPFVLLATVLFVFSGISRKVHVWEGGLYLVLYGLFIGKLFAFI